MNTSKFAACPSLGANAIIASTNKMPAIQLAVCAPPPAGFDREQQRGERDREHRDHADRPERGGAEEGERSRVDVRNEWRLAVGRLLVELPAFLDHVGLRREERLVGVEHRHEERGEAEHERERQQHEEQARASSRRPIARVATAAGPAGAGAVGVSASAGASNVGKSIDSSRGPPAYGRLTAPARRFGRVGYPPRRAAPDQRSEQVELIVEIALAAQGTLQLPG